MTIEEEMEEIQARIEELEIMLEALRQASETLALFLSRIKVDPAA